MRAMKRTVSVLLSLMLVLGMMTIGMSVASAAETKVTATSNIGATASADYTASSEQVTVTYKLNTAATISGVRAVITYDKAVLKLATTNTAATCFPTLNESLVANLTKTDGRLPFNASSYNGYDFAGGAVLATVVFDIIGTGNTTVDLEVKDLISIKNAPSQSDDDEVVIIDDATNDTSKYTATAEVTVSPSGIDPSVFIQDVRIALEGKIGLNYYLLDAPEGYDASKLSAEWVGENEEENVTLNYSAMPKGKRKNVYVRTHSYYLYSFMMTQPVTLNIKYNGETVCSYTLSIVDWVDQHISEFEGTNPAAVRLVKTMLNYGAAAQVQFDEYTDKLANENCDLPLEQITADQIQVSSGLNVAPNLSSIGANFVRQTAELKSGIAIRIYVSVTDATKFAQSSVTCEGQTLTYTGGTKSKVATYDNIFSFEMDKDYTFTFSNGATYKTSIMSYVKNLLANNPDNENIVNIVSAMYWYNQAANAVFE